MTTITLHSLNHFTMGELGEFVSFMPEDALEIEEGTRIRIVCHGACVFEGDVCHVWVSNVGVQIIQAVVVSASSSGSENPAANRLLDEFESLIDDLSDYDRRYLMGRLNRRFQRKKTE